MPRPRTLLCLAEAAAHYAALGPRVPQSTNIATALEHLDMRYMDPVSRRAAVKDYDVRTRSRLIAQLAAQKRAARCEQRAP